MKVSAGGRRNKWKESRMEERHDRELIRRSSEKSFTTPNMFGVRYEVHKVVITGGERVRIEGEREGGQWAVKKGVPG
jgi:hypothetical protein